MAWLLYGIYCNKSVQRPEPAMQPVNRPITTTEPPESVAVENHLLLFTISRKRQKLSSLEVALLYSRIKYTKVNYAQKRLPSLTLEQGIGRYSVLVLEDLRIYVSMQETDRVALDQYCRRYGVGIIYFVNSLAGELLLKNKLLDYPLSFSTGIPLSNYLVLPSNLTYLTKAPADLGLRQKVDWTVFHLNHSTYQVLGQGYATKDSGTMFNLAVLDHGLLDGVRRVFFGYNHQLWLHKILFLDALTYLTDGSIKYSRARYLQIDIDDIFLGKNGTKMTEDDVEVSFTQPDF